MSNKQKRKQKFKTVKRVWNAGTVYKAPSIVCQIRQMRKLNEFETAEHLNKPLSFDYRVTWTKF